jgi:hypothetical protein
MSGAAQVYTKEMFTHFKKQAAWFPNSKVGLGDVGALQGGMFEFKRSATQTKLRFDTKPLGSEIDLSHASGYTINHGAGTTATAPGYQFAFTLNFKSSGSFLFQATGCVEHEIDDKLKLSDQVSRLYMQGRWKPEWCLVESLYEVQRATILVSHTNGSSCVLGTNAALPAGPVPFAQVQGGMSLVNQSGDVQLWTAAKPITPLFGLLRLKRTWIQKLQAFFGRGPVERDPTGDPESVETETPEILELPEPENDEEVFEWNPTEDINDDKP